MEKLTVEILIALSGAILSLLAFYVPAFKRWMEGSLGEWKFLFMAGVLLLVAAGYLLIYCQLAWACIQANWGEALLVWLGALGANQGTYQAVVKPAKERLKKIRG